MKEKIVGLKELRENIEKYAKGVEKGEEYIVAKKSKPLFKITSPEKEEDWETVVDFTEIKDGGVELEEILSRI
jgi:prevent-host-death family protein